MAPLVRTGGSRHTGLAALPHHNIHPELEGTDHPPVGQGLDRVLDNAKLGEFDGN